MDTIDRAQQDIDFLQQVESRRSTAPEAKATGYCLYCGEPVAKGQRWCSRECYEDWNREQEIRRRQMKK